jgi:hypothetical protein
VLIGLAVIYVVSILTINILAGIGEWIFVLSGCKFKIRHDMENYILAFIFISILALSVSYTSLWDFTPLPGHCEWSGGEQDCTPDID